MTRQHRLLSLCGLILGLLPATAALAVGDVGISVQGQAVESVTLELERDGKVTTLTTKEEDSRCRDERQKSGAKDDDNNRCGPIWWWRDKEAGIYTLRVRAGGKVIRTETVEIKDGQPTRYTVNAATGVATLVPPALTTAQVQQNIFWLAAMLGYSYSHVNASIFSPFGSGSTDLNGGGLTGALEATLFPFARPGYLANVFFFAGMLGDGTQESKTYVSFHPTPGLDSGSTMDIKYGVRGGAGVRITVSRETALALFAGIAYTRAKSTIFTDEIGGGGTFNQFSRTQGYWGPMVGLELATGIPAFAQSTAAQLFFRAERTWMNGSTDIAGTSTLTFPYGGVNNFRYTDRIMLGLRFALK